MNSVDTDIRVHRRYPARLHLVLLCAIAVVLMIGAPGKTTSSAQASTDFGSRDFSYAASGVSAPTGQKPQSKLWFNDGFWWGVLFNKSADEYHIYRYDWTGHTWGDRGTVVDERNNANPDALWDGNAGKLYIASAGPSAASTADSGRFLRYSYDPATKSYSMDQGFPATVSSGGMEAIVVERDTTGRFWITYTQHSKVYVNHSLDGTGGSWGTPFVLPVAGASNLTYDDISAVISFDSKIGVMWSNQNDGAMYFATHTDGASDNSWQVQAAIKGTRYADDHINLKSLQADPSGQVFAAVKTSRNDGTSPAPDTPLTLLLVRDQSGGWTSHTFGTVVDDHTRPIVLIDREHRNLYMFATAPVTGGTIYYKKTSLSNISFAAGRGTPFIQSSTDPRINNATSTKQDLNSTTGLLVMASDDSTGYYLHNTMDLGTTSPPPPPADTIAPATPTGLTATPSQSGIALAWNNNTEQDLAGYNIYRSDTAGGVFTKLNSSLLAASQYSDTAAPAGQYSYYRVTAVDKSGNESRPATDSTRRPAPDTTAPTVTIDSGPRGTVRSRSAAFGFHASESGVKFECRLDGGVFAGCSSPKSYTGLRDGRHVFFVQATDAAGNRSRLAYRVWIVDNRAPFTRIRSPRPNSATRDRTPVISAIVRDNRTDLSQTDISLFVDRRSTGFSYYRDQDLLRTVRRLSPGRHAIRVVARDAAGNRSVKVWRFSIRR